MTSPQIDTTSFHTCPRCGGHDIYDNDRSGEMYECRTCHLVERASTANVFDEANYRVRERWRNKDRIRPTTEELNQRVARTNAKFEETEKQKTWPLEWKHGPGTREQRAAYRAQLMARNVADGRPAKDYPEHDALFADVLAHPDDDGPRLAYAAWQRAQHVVVENIDGTMFDQSNHLARFIEAQIATAQRLRADPRADLDADARALHPTFSLWDLRGGIMQYGEFDLEDLRSAGLIDHLLFFRGFIEHVAVKAHRFLEIADELFSLAPIRHLTITYVKGLGHDDPGVLRALAAAPHLARIRSLKLPARIVNNHHTRLNALTDDDLAVLAASPHLGRLAYLDLEDAGAITSHGLAHLARSPHLPALSFVGLDLYRYQRELGDWGDHTRTLVARPLPDLVAPLRAAGLDRPWFDAVRHYGTDRPDVEAVVEHPVAG